MLTFKRKYFMKILFKFLFSSPFSFMVVLLNNFLRSTTYQKKIRRNPFKHFVLSFVDLKRFHHNNVKNSFFAKSLVSFFYSWIYTKNLIVNSKHFWFIGSKRDTNEVTTILLQFCTYSYSDWFQVICFNVIMKIWKRCCVKRWTKNLLLICLLFQISLDVAAQSKELKKADAGNCVIVFYLS